MDIGRILFIAIVLVVAWFLWQRFVVPALKPPLDFLVWLVPALIAIAVILWLLSTALGIDILHMKVFLLAVPALTPRRWRAQVPLACLDSGW